MKAIILTTEIDFRLIPLTSSRPRCMLEVAGKPIIGFQVEALQAYVDEIIICTAYKSDVIKKFCLKHYPTINITYTENKHYNITNNLHSLWISKEHLTDDTIIISSNVIFEKKIISELAGLVYSALAVEVQYLDKKSDILLKQNSIDSITSEQTISEPEILSTNIYFFTKKDTESIKKISYKIF